MNLQAVAFPSLYFFNANVLASCDCFLVCAFSSDVAERMSQALDIQSAVAERRFYASDAQSARAERGFYALDVQSAVGEGLRDGRITVSTGNLLQTTRYKQFFTDNLS
jgi:hypothetical protein